MIKGMEKNTVGTERMIENTKVNSQANQNKGINEVLLVNRRYNMKNQLMILFYDIVGANQFTRPK